MAQEQSRNVRPLIVLLVVVSWAVSLWLVYHAPRAEDALTQYRRDFAPAVERASRSVVAIETETHASAEVRFKGAGSGFILEAQGLILTNEHVVHGADVIVVTLADRRRYFATLVAADPRSDIALLKVDAARLVPLELAPAEQVRRGQVVVALGNPLGSGADGTPAATFGRVARLNASLKTDLDVANDRFYDDLIQSTALTMPGSSGGPLIDEQGRAIGINTAMGLTVDAKEQFGFAIALNPRVRELLHELRQGNAQLHAFLGVETTELNEEYARVLGVREVSGALVATALVGSPAQQAGIQGGDLIRSIDGQRVCSAADLIGRINRLRPGRLISVELLRPGRGEEGVETFTLPVLLADRDITDLQGYTQEAALGSLLAWGIEVRPLIPWRRVQLGLPADQTGVLICTVKDDSPARSQGVRVGQVITHLGPYQVDNLADFAILAQKLPTLPQVRTLP